MQQDAHVCASTNALKVSLQVQACEIAYEQWKQLTFFSHAIHLIEFMLFTEAPTKKS